MYVQLMSLLGWSRLASARLLTNDFGRLDHCIWHVCPFLPLWRISATGARVECSLVHALEKHVGGKSGDANDWNSTLATEYDLILHLLVRWQYALPEIAQHLSGQLNTKPASEHHQELVQWFQQGEQVVWEATINGLSVTERIIIHRRAELTFTETAGGHRD